MTKAIASDSLSKLEEADDEDLSVIAEKGLWSLAELPSGFKAIGTKWVFQKKVNADDTAL